MQLDALREEKRCLGRQKADLENALEAEQEYIVHTMSKEVDRVAAEKAAVAAEKADLQRQVLSAVPTKRVHMPWLNNRGFER